MMKIVLLTDTEKIKEGLRSLTNEFIEEYPYYSTWINKNKETFQNGTRVVYELNDNGKTVGYMMVHFSSNKYAKINGVYVFADCQKKGYAKSAFLQVISELKKRNLEYVYVQTRTHNNIVVHMFRSLNFYIIGKNYHNIEQKYNWVAVYDLNGKKDFEEMKKLAEQIYPGFSEM